VTRPLVLLVGIALAAGCISAPESPPPVRYFSLEGRSEGEPSRVAAGLPLTLRHVRAPGYFSERIVWRRSDVEVGFYDDRRWSEPPAAIVERGLARELFVASGISRTEEKAPSLDVSVTGFEEVVTPEHEARVTLALLLRDAGGRTLLETTVSERRPVLGRDDPAAFANAMDQALGAALRSTVGAVSAALVASARERPAG
jgi:ABC-type uncharacterized transport system auxiliary subunit